MTHANSKKLGRPPLTEVDRIWNKIRNQLTHSAMSNMTIPQAEVFSVSATVHIGGYVRELVDYELTQALKELKEEQETEQKYVDGEVITYVLVEAIDNKIKELEKR